jgi:hypothetical protein
MLVPDLREKCGIGSCDKRLMVGKTKAMLPAIGRRRFLVYGRHRFLSGESQPCIRPFEKDDDDV